jgi:hypothetical protein
MIIDSTRRLAAMERAMRDVVIPAIDPKMANAREQAGYILNHLGLMIAQTDWEYPFLLIELRQAIALAKELSDICCNASVPPEIAADAISAIAEASPFAEYRLPALGEIKQSVHKVRAACDGLLGCALDGPPDIAAAAARATLAFARGREGSDAAWSQGRAHAFPSGHVDATIADEFA